MGRGPICGKDIGICSDYLIPRCTLPLPSLPSPVDTMLVGPYPPTHGSSYHICDAMERRGRSRTIPTTAAIRKSLRHQRQLYYSHYPTNPLSPSPSPSPVRSPQYVSLVSPHSPVVIPAHFKPPQQLGRVDFPTIHHARTSHATRNFARLLRISPDSSSVAGGPDPRSVRARQHSPRQGSLSQASGHPCSQRLRPPDRTGPRGGFPLRKSRPGRGG